MSSFLALATASSGKGPSSMKCDRADQSTQLHVTKAYTAEFANKNAMTGSAREENNNPHFFVLGSGEHGTGLSKRKSIEGSFVSKN